MSATAAELSFPTPSRQPVTPSAVVARPVSPLGDAIDIEQLRQYVQVVRRKLAPGQYLYRAGQPFHALFLIHAGFLKLCQLSDDGREQVTGFRMRGELLGVESIGMSVHSSDAVALESCEVWELPYPPVLTACWRIPELQIRLTEAMAAEIRRDRSWMLALGTMSAEQRVAAFLLDVAERHQALGFSPTHFILRMGRVDIGSFLALKHETVTRALSHLTGTGCIALRRREVRMVDPKALRELVGRASLH